MDYYKERFQWSEQTVSSIDWDLFGIPYKRQCKKHHHFTHKFCMRKLPLGARLHKMDPKYDPRCPTCHGPLEDDQHLLQCPHDSRRLWRRQLMDKLKGTVLPFLAPSLADIAREGITRAIFPELHPPFMPDQYPNQSKLIHAIGWDQFLRGKLSKEWVLLQSEFEDNQKQEGVETPVYYYKGTHHRKPKTIQSLFSKLLQGTIVHALVTLGTVVHALGTLGTVVHALGTVVHALGALGTVVLALGTSSWCNSSCCN